MVGWSRETLRGPDAFACGAVPEVRTPLRASSLNPDLVTGGVSLAGSRQDMNFVPIFECFFPAYI